MPEGTDFYAVIRETSTYARQDGLRPFPVRLAHEPDGYIRNGNSNRNWLADLWLLYTPDDPLVVNERRIEVVSDPRPKTLILSPKLAAMQLY